MICNATVAPMVALNVILLLKTPLKIRVLVGENCMKNQKFRESPLKSLAKKEKKGYHSTIKF